MSKGPQPHIRVERDGPLLHVTPYSSNGSMKRRHLGITVDLRDKTAAKEELEQHIKMTRDMHGFQGK